MFRYATFLFLLIAIADQCWADIIPPGLMPGDQYRLVFVTRDGITAASEGLAAYDAFVNSQASAGSLTGALGITWQVLGSSETQNANSHTNSLPSLGGVPIFTLSGAKVADNYSDLWDLSIDSPINIDQDGNTANAEVWTGSSATGAKRSNRWLGADSLVTVGQSSSTTASWMSQSSAGVASEQRRLYGMSSVLTAVPEPSSAGLLLFASVPLFWRRR